MAKNEGTQTEVIRAIDFIVALGKVLNFDTSRVRSVDIHADIFGGVEITIKQIADERIYDVFNELGQKPDVP